MAKEAGIPSLQVAVYPESETPLKEMTEAVERAKHSQ